MPDNRDYRDYIAIIDIGSNAVRLVVYDGVNRAPLKIHNERTVCNLGADLVKTGRLAPEGVRRALDSLKRFSGLLQAMKIKNIRAVATDAVRGAADGPEFVARVEKECGLKVEVVDGQEEARLSALGVLANGLGVDGVIGDYGGGSLELIVIEGRRVRHKASLPLGSHRLLAEKDREACTKLIDGHLNKVGFLKDYAGHDFYALGGAWRSMAKAHMRMVGHPLLTLDHYEIEGGKATDYAGLLSRQSPASLEKIAGMSKKRVKDMGVAALAMERVFAHLRPDRLVFSGTGLREGLIYDRLPPAFQRQDPLLSGAAKVAVNLSRFNDLRGFVALAKWMAPLFDGRDTALMRLLKASCLLSDTGWFEHEDYQAGHVFERILVMPLYGVDHRDRAFLALSQYVRYKGYLQDGDVTHAVRRIMDEQDIARALAAGAAQHLAYRLTGGALSLLRKTELRLMPGRLTLKLQGGARLLQAEGVEEDVKALAAILGREGVIEAG